MRNTETNQKYDYMIFNIFGLLSAAYLDRSKKQDFLLFRLAEDMSTIIIHERVQKQIESAGIDTIQFALPVDHIRA